MEERTRQALIAMRKILRATESSARALSRVAGLTNSQALTLQILMVSGSQPAGRIAARIGLSQATMTALLEKLSVRGLVRRHRGEADRRQVWIELTAEGRTILESLPNTLQSRFGQEFERLRDWEQAGIVSALERIVDMLGADSIDAAPLLELGVIGSRTDENSGSGSDSGS